MLQSLRSIPSSTIEYYGTIILFAWIGVIILFERIYPYKTGIKLFRKGFWTDFIWYTLIQSYFLKIIIFDYIILPCKKLYLPFGIDWFNKQSMLLLILFFLISHDFYIYLFHRFQHANKYFWRSHEAHHSGKDCDWLTGSRSHFIEILINQTIEFLPIFLLLDYKLAMIIVPIKALLDAIFGLWIHANTSINIGVLKYVINSPLMHQWHHSNHQEVFYANYATKFSFFDFIFNTAYLPKNKESKPILYGLPYKYPNDYFIQSTFSVYRFSINKHWVKEMDNLSEKIRNKLLKTILPKSSTQFIDSYILDKTNSKYIDYVCPNCKNVLSKHCIENTIFEYCNQCSSNMKYDERR